MVDKIASIDNVCFGCSMNHRLSE